MLKNVFYGMCVGIVNIIPGVSGGTVIVLLGIFDKTTTAISNVWKKENIIYLAQLLLGVIIGLVGFAKVIDFLLDEYYVQTIFWFIGLIVFGIPILLKSQMRGMKLKIIPFLLGIIVILFIGILNKGSIENTVDLLPTVSVLFLLEMVLLGFISGAATIFPGISGSMLLLVLGYYGLYSKYLAEVTSAFSPLNFNILIPLAFIALGVLLGIYFSSRIVSNLLHKYRAGTMSLILGLVAASAFILIPIIINIDGGLSVDTLIKFDFINILTYIFSFGFGGVIIYILEKTKKKEA